ncbi:hypothetical protein Tco_1022948, partial [Tanacetum coccineum]
WLWLCYWILHSIAILGECVDVDLDHNAIDYLSRYPVRGFICEFLQNKPVAVLHWLDHVESVKEYIRILDADIIMRGPITHGSLKQHVADRFQL